MYELRLEQRAFKVALDPTPSAARQLASHAGGARYAYNWGLARIQAALDARQAEEAEHGEATTPVPGHFDLCSAWTQWKDTAEWADRATGEVTSGVPWVASNSSATYQAALRDADKAWKDYFKSLAGQRAGRALGSPRFRSKHRSRPKFQTHGGVRLASATRLVLPRIGPVTIMSDDSRHPAMARSRRRTPGQRHMGNRRRSAHLWRQLQHGGRLAERARTILADAYEHAGGPPAAPRIISQLNAMADARAQAAATEKRAVIVEKAKAALTKALEALAKGERDGLTEKRLAAARRRAEKAAARLEAETKRLEKARTVTAERTARWTDSKLDQAITTGQVGPVAAADLAAALGLTDEQTATLTDAGMQPRIIRASISLGADGLWWASLGCEIPVRVRTRPSRRQQQRGPVGIDLGVRHTATLSQRLGGQRDIDNPRHLEAALAELATAQRQVARRTEGSARHAKAKARVGLIHADVARLREQHLQRASTRIASTFSGVAVEGHDLVALAHNGSRDLPARLRRQRNRSLADSSAGKLRDLLTQKSSRYGTTLTVAEPGTPTGRTCARCGATKAKSLPPWQEQFRCGSCGHTAPRRLNTARTLERSVVSSGPPDGGSDQSRGEGVRPAGLRPGRQSSMKRAARTLPLGGGQTGISGARAPDVQTP